MDRRSYFKEKARTRGAHLLRQLEGVEALKEGETTELARKVAPEFLHVLEQVALHFPTLLEAACTPGQWERIRTEASAQIELPLDTREKTP